jgi:hypothetical protein
MPNAGMSYSSIPFFHKVPLGVQMYRPSGPVECRVVRADLFGAKVAGHDGVYHSGILFQADGREWAFELVLDDYSSLVPDIVNGRVTNSNFVTLGYYPPLDAHLWRSYWSYTSPLTCTITAAQYAGLVHYVLTGFGPTFLTYDIFGVQAKPVVTQNGRRERQTDRIYTVDNICDKLPMRCFMHVAGVGVRVAPFPIMRSVLQSPEPPVRLAADDPGLLAYAREMQRYKRAFGMLAAKDLLGVFSLFASIKLAQIGAFRYVLSLDPKTFEQSYYLLPTDDVTLSLTDVFLHLDSGRSPGNRHHGHGGRAEMHAAIPPTELSAAIVATTLNPMDYLTNARGSTRPNSLLAANLCMAQRTIGIHPAQQAAACVSMSANSLHQEAQSGTVGFFQPPWNDHPGAAGAALAIGAAEGPAAPPFVQPTGLPTPDDDLAAANLAADDGGFGWMLPDQESVGAAVAGPTNPYGGAVGPTNPYDARDWLSRTFDPVGPADSNGSTELPYSDGEGAAAAAVGSVGAAVGAAAVGSAAAVGASDLEPHDDNLYGYMVDSRHSREVVVTAMSPLPY